jgi:ATP-dependent HslUV protease ATP-binding subunit HslU
MAAQLNKTVENIGARRLHTVLERIMETISFDAAEMERGSVSPSTSNELLRHVVCLSVTSHV